MTESRSMLVSILSFIASFLIIRDIYKNSSSMFEAFDDLRKIVSVIIPIVLVLEIIIVAYHYFVG